MKRYSRKQITFDLDTKVLKEIHGKKNYTRAYSDIREFMEDNGFSHIEGTVYSSNHGMDSHEVLTILDDLKSEYPYFEKCIRKIHQTNVGRSYSLDFEFDYDGTAGEFAMNKENQEQEKATPPPRNRKGR